MRYMIAIHHPDNYDPSLEDEAMVKAIDDLNVEMIEAGVRQFAEGLRPVGEARSLTADTDGSVSVKDGPYLKGDEHIGGFWILDVANMDEALSWGRKAVIACRTPVEVRPFY